MCCCVFSWYQYYVFIHLPGGLLLCCTAILRVMIIYIYYSECIFHYSAHYLAIFMKTTKIKNTLTFKNGEIGELLFVFDWIVKFNIRNTSVCLAHRTYCTCISQLLSVISIHFTQWHFSCVLIVTVHYLDISV